MREQAARHLPALALRNIVAVMAHHRRAAVAVVAAAPVRAVMAVMVLPPLGGLVVRPMAVPEEMALLQVMAILAQVRVVAVGAADR